MTRIELPQVSPCTGCGNCCRHIGLPPFEVPNPDLGPQPAVQTFGGCHTCQQLRDTETFAAMPAELRAEHARMVRDLTEDPTGRPCAWLDVGTGACRHYEHRPACCQDFKVGELACIVLQKGQNKCVWIEPAPPEVWRNPRSARRWEFPAKPHRSRWQGLRRWFCRNVVEVKRDEYLEPGDMRLKTERAVYVRFLPRYEVRLWLWGVRFRRRCYRIEFDDVAKPV